MNKICTHFRGGIFLIVLAAPSVCLANQFECMIEPNKVVMLSSPTEGLIEEIYVKRGDRITTGQRLVKLESSAELSAVQMAKYKSQMEGRIASAKHRLEYATKKLERSDLLQKQSYVSAQARDEAEAEWHIAEADLRDAIESKELAKHEHQHYLDLLNLRTIRSPFNGVVMDRMLNPGDLAEGGSGRKAILKLAHVDPLRVEVVLPIEVYKKLRVGMKGEVMPEGLGGRYFATIKVVDSIFDSASGTFGISLELANHDQALPAGIRCRIEFPMFSDVEVSQVKPRAAKPNEGNGVVR